MIVGIGLDLVEIERVERTFLRFGRTFAEKILCPAEVDYCLSHTRPSPHLAARFAAKEAFSKALGTGIGAQLGWHDIEIMRSATGQPTLLVHGKAVDLLRTRGIHHTHLSLTHAQSHAAAVVVLES